VNKRQVRSAILATAGLLVLLSCTSLRVLHRSTVPLVHVVPVPLNSLIIFYCTLSPDSKLGTESSHLTPHANCSIMSRSLGKVPWRFEASKRYQIILSAEDYRIFLTAWRPMWRKAENTEIVKTKFAVRIYCSVKWKLMFFGASNPKMLLISVCFWCPSVVRIGPRLLLRTNRKSHTRFRLAPISITSDDLERPKRHSYRNKQNFRSLNSFRIKNPRKVQWP